MQQAEIAYQVIADIFRQEEKRILATLLSTVKDFELAEDVLQDTLLVALEQWPATGIPHNPGAWMTITARHKAIDRLRRQRVLVGKQEILQKTVEQEALAGVAGVNEHVFPDERLKLIFTCCHPALALEAQIALTLHTLGTLSTYEIANAFLIPPTTMAQRLVRAKRKIKNAGIPYDIPPVERMEERIEAVFSVLYLIFNEGYAVTLGPELIRGELCEEAIWLTRLLVMLLEREALLTPLAEALGLLALMLLHDTRRMTRIEADGKLILLDEQDRTRWDQKKAQEGLATLERALSLKQAGPYQIQAAISALHVEAETFNDTDWAQIVSLYQVLRYIAPSPVIDLNWAVAVAMAQGPVHGLALLERPEIEAPLRSYYLFHASRADLLRRSGQMREASDAYTLALNLCHNEIERSFLQCRLAEVLQHCYN